MQGGWRFALPVSLHRLGPNRGHFTTLCPNPSPEMHRLAGQIEKSAFNRTPLAFDPATRRASPVPSTRCNRPHIATMGPRATGHGCLPDDRLPVACARYRTSVIGRSVQRLRAFCGSAGSGRSTAVYPVIWRQPWPGGAGAPGSGQPSMSDANLTEVIRQIEYVSYRELPIPWPGPPQGVGACHKEGHPHLEGAGLRAHARNQTDCSPSPVKDRSARPWAS